MGSVIALIAASFSWWMIMLIGLVNVLYYGFWYWLKRRRLSRFVGGYGYTDKGVFWMESLKTEAIFIPYDKIANIWLDNQGRKKGAIYLSTTKDFKYRNPNPDSRFPVLEDVEEAEIVYKDLGETWKDYNASKK